MNRLRFVATVLAAVSLIGACTSSSENAPSSSPSVTCGPACESSSAASAERAQVAGLQDDCSVASAKDVAAIEAGLVTKSHTVTAATVLPLLSPISGYTRVVAARIDAVGRPVGVWALGSPYIDSLNAAALRYSNYGRAAEEGSQAELDRIALQSAGESTAVAKCVEAK